MARNNIFQGICWRWVIVTGLVAKFLMPALMFPYMVVYSYLIHSGETEAFYQQYVLDYRVAFSLWAGIPFFFLLGWFVGRRVRTSIIMTNVLIWAIYVLLDVHLEILFTGKLLSLGLPLFLAHLTKLAAAYLGSLLAIRQNPFGLRIESQSGRVQ